MAAAGNPAHNAWAKEKGVDPAHAIVIANINNKVTDEQITKDLNTIGAGKIADRRDVEDGGKTTHEVLYVFKGKVSALLLGDTISAAGGAQWAVSRLTVPDDPVGTFEEELAKFLAVHKKSKADLAIPEAVHQHVHIIKNELNHSRPQYRRLRTSQVSPPCPMANSPLTPGWSTPTRWCKTQTFLRGRKGQG